MAVNYKIVKQCQPGIKGGGQWKYYARACNRSKLSLDDLSRDIVLQSSLSRGDIISVITMFTDMVPDKLKEGYTVDLGSLGIFSLSIKSEGKDAPEKVSSHSITGVQINFRPGVKMKKEIKDVRFVKGK